MRDVPGAADPDAVEGLLVPLAVACGKTAVGAQESIWVLRATAEREGMAAAGRAATAAGIWVLSATAEREGMAAARGAATAAGIWVLSATAEREGMEALGAATGEGTAVVRPRDAHLAITAEMRRSAGESCLGAA